MCGRGGMHGRGVCVAGMRPCVARGVYGRGCVWQGGMHGRGHSWQGGHAGQGGKRGGGLHCRIYGHCSRQYAS